MECKNAIKEFADVLGCDAGGTSIGSALCGLSKINKGIITQAIHNASKGHKIKKEVREMLEDIDKSDETVLESLKDGSYKNKIAYRQLVKTSSKGKPRNIDSPSLFTRVLQHLFILLIRPIYDSVDNMNGLNCKEGCGITAKEKSKSIVSKLKSVYFDRRDLNYAVIIDQRKCYEHITKKLVRKSLKYLTRDKWLIDFGIDVSFCGDRFPIGTPTSPLLHHIVCLRFDHWCKSASSFSIRYADNCFLAVHTREEAQQLLWRVRNYWWYELGIRAKRKESRVVPLTEPLDFCGYIFHRISDKCCNSHNKGYVTVRRSIMNKALHCKKAESYASYFGILKHADAFNKLLYIERGNMKLSELTEKVKIKRKMDAPNIKMLELVDKTFTIYEYEIRLDSKTGEPNYIKCVIGMDELDDEGNPTGRILAKEFHGNYSYLIEFIVYCENEFGKENLLPMNEMVIEQSCGYIFRGSTYQMKYIK